MFLNMKQTGLLVMLHSASAVSLHGALGVLGGSVVLVSFITLGIKQVGYGITVLILGSF